MHFLNFSRKLHQDFSAEMNLFGSLKEFFQTLNRKSSLITYFELLTSTKMVSYGWRRQCWHHSQ